MIEHYFQPRGFRRALGLKARWGSDAVAVVGGTDLMVKLRAGRAAPRVVVDLGRAGVSRIRWGDGWLSLGAAATVGDFLRLAWSREAAPALWKACGLLGGPQVQNAATFAGNLANASPAADTVPVLIALGAEVVVESLERGARRVPAEEFALGPGRTVLAPDELIREVLIPCAALNPRALPGAARRSSTDDAKRRIASPPSDDLGKACPLAFGRVASEFFKTGARRAQIISVACLAGWAWIEDETPSPGAASPGAASSSGPGGSSPTPGAAPSSGRIGALRLVAGGVAPRAVRLRALEDRVLERGGVDPDTLDAAEALARQAIAPIDDVRGSAEYKAAVVCRFARLFLESLAVGEGGVRGACASDTAPPAADVRRPPPPEVVS